MIAAARARPILWWALLGLSFVALQAYIFGSWIGSADFRAADPGPDALTPLGRITMWGLAFSFVPLGALAGLWVLATILRGRDLSTVQIVMIGCGLCLWQDATVNLVRPVALYNTHYPNMGTWAAHIPWWLSPNGSGNAQPLTFQSALYFVMVPVWVYTAYGVMTAAKRLWPALVGPHLVLIAVAFITIAQTGAEVAMVRGEIFAYGGTIHALTVFPGTRWQFPVYGAFLWALGTVALGCLLYWRAGDGRTLVEAGLERVKAGVTGRNILRALAMTGAANLAILLYYLGFMVVSLYSDPWPTDFPSYFRNGICGEGTGYACPAPDLPIPTRTVPPNAN
ncbi:spirocyclase AveC family protein [Zavarzinia compransoris]|uniref:Spirocyclase, AveC family n=1 Tax=Zavarzinia compransoris TaxID=1264899 RepID=A0A317DSB8_9PROT|nr:spirocyclase AveC family protein [Zavarzinia compransoris]PWR17568.1 hypothetical protein DKG75_22485 [Zavarzinia compransoris]TDP49226.1 uncharacterized protein DUF5135 [Zavarzinia compransoris]